MTESKEKFRHYIRSMPVAIDGNSISTGIMSHPWYLDAGVVMAFYPMSSEPDIVPVLQDILVRGKTLVLPKCHENGIMTVHRVHMLSLLHNGAYGIMEPGDDCPVFLKADIDLVLVPGLAFTVNGKRMGRGKGYYDRFLADYHGKVMGVCSHLVAEIPCDDHDIVMDAVVTEQKIYYRLEGEACSRKK